VVSSVSQSINSVTVIAFSEHLSIYFMGNAIGGGETAPATAALVVLPPLIIFTVAILAIKCVTWLPAIRRKIGSWTLKPFLSRGRKRTLSDPPLSSDTALAVEPPVELEGNIGGIERYDSAATLVE